MILFLPLLPAVALLSCVRGSAPGGEAVDPLEGGPPAITDVDWACDVDEARWTLAVEADAWTGGGRLWIARDAATVEAHAVRSVSAPADGSADALELELDVAADWRDAVSGSSTRFRCDDEPELTYQLDIYTVDGEERADCRAWGADPALWEAAPDVDACAALLDEGGR